MRLLHTSDWHLGRTTHGVSRAVDHDTVLAEIVTAAREHRPDLIVHSGDLFDQVRPSYPDIATALDVLGELAEVAPVVVICGNHDSPQLFRILGRALGPNRGIHLVDEPRNPSGGGVLRFPGPDYTQLRLGVLPFIHPNRFVDAFDDPATWRGAYADRVGAMERAIADELARDFDPSREVSVFAAHLHVGGAGLANSERGAHTSEQFETRSDDIPKVDYAAFGHIHKPQAIPGSHVVGRFAGSPLQLDFGEVGERKSIVLVDLEPGRPAQIELIGLTGGRQLRRFDGTLDQLRALAPSVGNDICLLTVRTPTHEPTLSAQVEDLLPHAAVIRIDENCDDRTLHVLTKDAVADDAEPDLCELLEQYLADEGTSSSPAVDVRATFDTVLESTRTEQELRFPVEELLDMPLPIIERPRR